MHDAKAVGGMVTEGLLKNAAFEACGCRWRRQASEGLREAGGEALALRWRKRRKGG